MQNSQKSHKEQRIREITLIYYSRTDIKKAIFQFAKDRECIPRYYEGFGKRPDTFQYESDILEHVRKGATSFHSSEELWYDPLEISTEMSRTEFDNLRIGWDLLLDIDSPYLEYSKIYAELLIKELENHKIKNIGIKFSGSKGFHIIIPWKAFPEKIYNQETKNMFPEWARAICGYLAEKIQPELADKILEKENSKELLKKTGKQEEELIITECLKCNRPSTKKYLITWFCPICKSELTNIKKNNKIPKCPNENCRKTMIEKETKEIHFCEFCNITSDKNPSLFREKERFATEKLIDADLVLVAPRHLFRMPYSLHEKTALASIVLEKNNITNFQIKDANPFKAQIKNFYPTPEPEEARELLLRALDWKEYQDKKENQIKESEKIETPLSNKKQEYKKIIIEEPSEEIFPPQIKLLLQGVKQDGRKRALTIILSFLKSLGAKEEYIERKIYEWNDKNYNPLKKGYIMSQLSWYKRHPNRLPPNFNNPIYRELGVDKPDELAKQNKNPLSYAIKRYFELQRKN